MINKYLVLKYIFKCIKSFISNNFNYIYKIITYTHIFLHKWFFLNKKYLRFYNLIKLHNLKIKIIIKYFKKIYIILIIRLLKLKRQKFIFNNNTLINN